MKEKKTIKKWKRSGEPGSPEEKKECMKYLTFLPCLLLICLSIPVSADAAGLESTQLVQGAKNLAEDAAKVGLFLEAAVLTALEIKEGLALQAASVEEAPKHKKKMIGMAGVGVLIICFTALIPVLFGYFQ